MGSGSPRYKPKWDEKTKTYMYADSWTEKMIRADKIGDWIKFFVRIAAGAAIAFLILTYHLLA